MKSVFVVQIYSTLTNNMIKYTPECTRLSQRTCNLQNFPGGACPRTPLDYFVRLLYFIHRLQLCLKWRTLGWFVLNFARECTPVECCNFAPEFAPDLINRLSALLCTYGDEDMPLLFVSPVLFDQSYLCRNFTPKIDPDWINRPSDLMNHFELVYMYKGSPCDVLSLCDLPVIHMTCL